VHKSATIPMHFHFLVVQSRGLTLPPSGRQGAWGGVAESWWGPVHSRGLFEGVIHRLQLSIEQLREEDKNPSMSSAPTNLARNPDSRLLLGNSVTRL
jgi:hypothetical protein